MRKGRIPCALATVVQSAGSTPQKEGAKMLVREDGSISGTLGGGCLEAEVITIALAAIKDGLPLSVPFNLTGEGLLCGGRMLVYIEPITPEPDLVILGAGHIGRALATAGAFAGFRVTVIDDREEYANKTNIPHAHEVAVRKFEEAFDGMRVDEYGYIVIATRGHAHDLEAVKAALKTAASYIGLVGSRRKKAIFASKLGEAGFSGPEISRLSTPAGLPIGSVSPEEIAISILAEIIKQRRSNARTGLGSPACGGLLEEVPGTGKTAPSP